MRDLSLHLLDLTMNSIRAKATLIEIKFIESKKMINSSWSLKIMDVA